MIVVLETGTSEKQIEEIIRVSALITGLTYIAPTGGAKYGLGRNRRSPSSTTGRLKPTGWRGRGCARYEPFNTCQRAFKREGSVFDIGE